MLLYATFTPSSAEPFVFFIFTFFYPPRRNDYLSSCRPRRGNFCRLLLIISEIIVFYSFLFIQARYTRGALQPTVSARFRVRVRLLRGTTIKLQLLLFRLGRKRNARRRSCSVRKHRPVVRLADTFLAGKTRSSTATSERKRYDNKRYYNNNNTYY